jgi:hypothetical protein
LARCGVTALPRKEKRLMALQREGFSMLEIQTPADPWQGQASVKTTPRTHPPVTASPPPVNCESDKPTAEENRQLDGRAVAEEEASNGDEAERPPPASVLPSGFQEKDSGHIEYEAEKDIWKPLCSPLKIVARDRAPGKVAGSVWGCRSPRLGFGLTWEATANGLEGMARAHSDTFMVLDELGQADPQVAARTAYQLANGSEKIRGARQGGARPTGSWVLLFMSTGEVSLADKVAEYGKRAKAGQQVRILDLPADAGAGHGAFEKLHRFNSGKDLAEHLDKAAGCYHGHAGRYFLYELMRCDQHEFIALAERYMKAFEEECGAVGDSGQVGRAARRFALIAFAGEMATKWSITPWPKGAARSAAKRMFADWVEARGGRGSHESMDALEFVRGLLGRYGGSRFAAWGTQPRKALSLWAS